MPHASFDFTNSLNCIRKFAIVDFSITTNGYNLRRRVFDAINHTRRVDLFNRTSTDGIPRGIFSIDVIKNINTENEAREKMNAAVKEFSRQLVKGTGSSGEFVGMNKYCTDNDLVSEIEFDLTGKLTSSKAESFYADFTEMLGSLRVDANAIITDRTLESKLVALEGLLHKNVVKATIGKVDYNTYQGLNILPVENGTCLRTVDVGTTTDTYIDFYVVRLSTTDGVFCASPNGAANFVKAIKPVENGTPLATGYVDFATCFIPKNKGAIIKGSVKISSVAKG